MIVVYGSMTGNTEKVMRKMMESWTKRDLVTTADMFDGNTIEHETEDLSALVTSYDVLIVATSSYGDGDPPDNYNKFLLQLLQAAQSATKPLKGMQHAVLGEGSSIYRETFQNCPRLTDKYLEECGSRRFLARHEIDVGGTEPEDIGRNLFREEVFLRLKTLPPAASAPAAKWAEPREAHGEPKDQIKIKTAADLDDGGPAQTLGQKLVPFIVIVLAIVAYVYFKLDFAS